MKIWSKPDNRAAADDVVVGSVRIPNMRKAIVAAICVVIIVTAGLAWWRLSVHYANANKAANAEMQKALAEELTLALNAPNNRAIVADASQLIDGANEGRFVVSQNILGWYYSDRANAYLNLKQYTKAAPDFEKSAALNSILKASALQGEFEARYKTGERKQLVPLLQTLVELERKSQSPVRGSLVNQYQDYMRALQQGREIML